MTRNPYYTREELLRRGAGLGALLAVPSFLAACGGDGAAVTAAARQRAS